MDISDRNWNELHGETVGDLSPTIGGPLVGEELVKLCSCVEERYSRVAVLVEMES